MIIFIDDQSVDHFFNQSVSENGEKCRRMLAKAPDYARK